ncbi:MAG TPA: alanine racemase [Anaerolineales bacterium]
MRPTYLEVNLSQLRQNLANIRAHVAPSSVMVMVKANAYGHGVDGVAPYIEPYTDCFGVALVEEAIALRALGIKKPILVAGGTLPEQLNLFLEYDLTLTASSSDLLAAAERVASSAQKRLKVHLKLDTGMERVGVREYDAEDFLRNSLACNHLDIEGIYTHLANSEIADQRFSRMQLERFHHALRFYEKTGAPPPRFRHVANSGGILQLREAHMDMVRPGVLFYGVYPGAESARNVAVKPALTWRSRVAYTKITRPGRPVSYGSLWQADRPSRIVTIPCGYADGYFRRMTNQARVIVNGKSYPQVGRICMDQFMVDLGEAVAELGDPVVLLGESITAEDLAAWSGTNEYEVLTNISARVPRVFLNSTMPE